MKYLEFIRILKIMGFFPIRQTGSHQTWSNGVKKVLVVNAGKSRDINRIIARKELRRLGYPGYKEI
jgi:predicted RNA binding protein YcfA (HicA-like mRNA interferase family)